MDRKFTSGIITCGYCNNISYMEVAESMFLDQTDYDPAYGHGYQCGDHYQLAQCPACRKENILRFHWYEEMAEDVEYETLYPKPENIPLGLPDVIQHEYIEAERIRNTNYNAYALLMRRILEQVCIENGAEGKMLANKLKDLSTKGIIPEKLVKVCKGLKDFGNIGAHVGIGQVSEKEIPIIKALCKAILEYIYTAPYLADLAEEQLKSIKNPSK